MPALASEPAAVRVVELTKVVASGALPISTCAPVMKLVPLIVRVKLPVPALAGVVSVSVGVGFSRVTALDADVAPLVVAVVLAVIVRVFGVGSVVGAA